MRKFLTVASILISIGASSQRSEWRVLFNGKDLSGWDTYIGSVFDSVTNEKTGSPIGLNNDPVGVFSVVNEDSQAALRISGQHFGGISTQEEFQNYHLKLEFKWGQKKWIPKKNQKRDSGLLYHAVGPHGADWGFWMRSQEFQIQEGDCGDYWGVAGGVFSIPAKRNEKGDYIYDASSPLYTFSTNSPQGRHCIKETDAEKPSGQWNVLELYCMDDTAVHIVNGKVVMILYKSRQLEGGKETPLTKGKIQIQSEGAEVLYRNIVVQSIKKIPAEILKR